MNLNRNKRARECDHLLFFCLYLGVRKKHETITLPSIKELIKAAYIYKSQILYKKTKEPKKLNLTQFETKYNSKFVTKGNRIVASLIHQK